MDYMITVAQLHTLLGDNMSMAQRLGANLRKFVIFLGRYTNLQVGYHGYCWYGYYQYSNLCYYHYLTYFKQLLLLTSIDTWHTLWLLLVIILLSPLHLQLFNVGLTVLLFSLLQLHALL